MDGAMNQSIHDDSNDSQTALLVVVPLCIILLITCATLVFVMLKRQNDLKSHGKQLRHLH